MYSTKDSYSLSLPTTRNNILKVISFHLLRSNNVHKKCIN